MKFYTVEKLGPKQELTPEGFLLCTDVPLARTGTMIYGPGETPVQAGADGIVRIERDAEEVFRPETIASGNGKPVVNEHPDGDVIPDNWKELAVGVGFNPHRGIGAQDDLLLGDLLITDKDTIPLVREGKREISLGYDADYEEIAPGRGRQKNILINHIALVDSGRCGPRCAIGDSTVTTNKEKHMTMRERIKNAFKAKDESALTAVLDDLPEEEEKKDGPVIHNHIHVRDDDDDHRTKDKEDEEEEEKEEKRKTTDARLKKVEDTVDSLATDVKAIKDRVMKDDDEEEEEEKEEKKKAKDNEKIEGSLEEEAPPGTGDKARKAKDSAYLEDSFQEAISLAEIIAPGIAVPTFDRASDPKKTVDSLCQFRRRVMDLAYNQPETRTFMDELLNGRDMKAYTCDGIRTMFRAVGVFKKNANNNATRSSSVHDGFGSGVVSTEIRTNADLNRRMAEIYK